MGIATPSQGRKCLLLRIHQYRIKMLYKHWPDLFIADWLSLQNHREDWDDEIPSMKITIDAIHTTVDIPECMLMQEVWNTTQDDEHLHVLTAYIINGWPLTKAEIRQDMQPNRIFYNKLAVTDRKMLKGRRIVISASLQIQALEQLHSNNMGTEKMYLLLHESI